MQEERGTCPFYKYKVTNDSEILSCQAIGEYIPVTDDDSLLKVAKGIDETCLGFEYIQCEHYKKKIKEQNK
jgi:hypothetical protein